jgi:hypothetical protein
MMAELEHKLQAIRRRLMLFLFVRVLSRALLVCLSLLVVGLVVMRLVVVPVSFWILLLGGVGVSLLSAVVATVWYRQSMFDAAMAADEHLQLRERLSSVLFLKNASRDNEAVLALLQDAQVQVEKINPRRDFKFQAPKPLLHLVWPVFLLICIYAAMPQYDLLAKTAEEVKADAQIESKEAKQQFRKGQAQKIQRLAEEVKQKEESLGVAENAEFSRDLERLSNDLELGTRTEKSAVAELSRLEEDVKAKQRELGRRQESFKQISGLRRAEETRELQQDLKDQNFSKAEQELEAMAAGELGNKSAEVLQLLSEEMSLLDDQLYDN